MYMVYGIDRHFINISNSIGKLCTSDVQCRIERKSIHV